MRFRDEFRLRLRQWVKDTHDSCAGCQDHGTLCAEHIDQLTGFAALPRRQARKRFNMPNRNARKDDDD